jgi:elongation factor P hydroxylase
MKQETILHKHSILKIEDIQNIFNNTFKSSYKTILKFGADEPFYKAAKTSMQFNEIICRSDFFSSALHEISHWCIAGKERRKKDDFGYWYNPDGKSLEDQLLFENHEVKPQALEWIFSSACNNPFKVSVDNLSLEEYDSSQFEKKVSYQRLKYLKTGIPKRARDFLYALEIYYKESKITE